MLIQCQDSTTVINTDHFACSDIKTDNNGKYVLLAYIVFRDHPLVVCRSENEELVHYVKLDMLYRWSLQTPLFNAVAAMKRKQEGAYFSQDAFSDLLTLHPPEASAPLEADSL